MELKDFTSGFICALAGGAAAAWSMTNGVQKNERAKADQKIARAYFIASPLGRHACTVIKGERSRQFGANYFDIQIEAVTEKAAPSLIHRTIAGMDEHDYKIRTVAYKLGVGNTDVTGLQHYVVEGEDVFKCALPVKHYNRLQQAQRKLG